MDPFRQVFLDQVRVAISKEANNETLYELLKIATPSLAACDISEELRRKKAFKTLQIRIHPDKHPGGSTTTLYQDVQSFYEACCAESGKRKANPNSPPSSFDLRDFPQDFHVQDKWTFLDMGTLFPEAIGLGDVDLTAHTVATCINARGAIAHGQPTKRAYTTESMKQYGNAQACFDAYGGTYHLTSTSAIKEELMEHGPVVSTSFVLHGAFLSAGEYSSSLLRSRIGKTHELLIVGWTLTSFGEVWLVKPLNGQVDPIRVAFGQFGIDDACLAPRSSFENTAWQSGPYYDTNQEFDEWMGWESMEMNISASKLNELARCFRTGLYAAISQGSAFVIRDKNKIAHSRTYCLEEIEWKEAENTWKVNVRKL